MTMDIDKFSSDMLRNVAREVEGLRATLPQTEDVDSYIKHWVRLFEEGAEDTKISPEMRSDALKNIMNSTAMDLARCIHNRCSREDQHLFMAGLVHVIGDVAAKATEALMEDLMGNDDFMKTIFGSGLN